MASDEVRINGVVVGRVVTVRARAARGGATHAVRFQPDHVGIMDASALELDKGRK